MQPPDARFYFSLPRLIWKLRGGSAARTETNWMEANIVGTAVFAISYGVATLIVPAGTSLSAQLAMAVPLLVATYFAWTLLLYGNSLIIRVLRLCGLMRRLPDARAQSLLIGIMTSAFAFQLLESNGWFHVLAAAWLSAVVVNLLAAAILNFIDRSHSDG